MSLPPECFHVVIPDYIALPLPPRLSPFEIMEEVQQITPNSIPAHDRQSEGAVLFAKAFDSGLVLLKWSDGVSVAVFSSRVTLEIGLSMYLTGRKSLEAHVANLERGAP
jgi:hypothetical protein